MPLSYRGYPLPFMDGHPLEESEWRNVIALLEQVNLPKAKVLSAIYREHVTTAWRNYLRVYEEARERITELNRRLDDQREQYERDLQMYLKELKEREAFWEDEIREPRKAYMQLSVAVEGISGAWPQNLTYSVHGPREYLELIQALSHREQEEQNTASDGKITTSPQAPPNQGEAPNSSDGGAPEQTQEKEETTNISKEETPERIKEDIPPVLTKEEVADEGQLPTFTEPPISVWMRLVLTCALGLLTAYLLCLATGMGPLNLETVGLSAVGASVVLYGIWTTVCSAAAVTSEAFHMQWTITRQSKLRTMTWLFVAVVFGLMIIQAVWHLFITRNLALNGTFAMQPAAIAGYLLWVLWPWFLLLAAMDGFLRGRRETVGNRVHAEIARANRAHAALQALGSRRETEGHLDSDEAAKRNDDNVLTPRHGANENPTSEEPTLQTAAQLSPAEAMQRYRVTRAQYESLRRQRDLELAFIGKRIKDMQAFLTPTHFVPSKEEQKRIEMARLDYEKICTWFLNQLADTLRDVGGGVNAGEIIRRFVEQFGASIHLDVGDGKNSPPKGGLA